MFNSKKKNYYSESLFEQRDFDEIVEELDIEKLSRQKALDNKPSSDSLMENSDEQKILNYFSEKLSFVKQEIHTKISIYEQISNGLSDVKNYISESKYAGENFLQDITTWKESVKHNLSTVKKNVETVKNDLSNFKIDNKLLREASYPESRVFHISIILLIILVETFLNAYFFAKGNEFGLLGGASQALIVSVINMVFAYFMGNFLVRNLQLVNHSFQRNFSIVAIFILIFFMFLFNLLVGHLRVQLGINPENAYNEAIEGFLNSPFGLTDFDSVVLVGLGVLVFILGTIDFFKMDDPYPGYGALSRKYSTAKEDYTETKESYLDDLENASTNSLKELEKVHASSKLKLKEIQEIPIFRQKLQVQYNEFYSYLNTSYQAVIGFYRNTNKEARSDNAPKYFETFKNLDDYYLIDCIDKDLKKNIAKVEAEMLEFPHIIAEEKSKINEIVKKTILSLENGKVE